MKLKLFKQYNIADCRTVLAVEIEDMAQEPMRVRDAFMNGMELLGKATLCLAMGANLPDMAWEEARWILKKLEEDGLDLSNYSQAAEFKALADEKFAKSMKPVYDELEREDNPVEYWRKRRAEQKSDLLKRQKAPHEAGQGEHKEAV